ncbi:MAG: polysaccharide biosynthesis tyrosine autokinase [Cyclobacteriaceae bacterium]|nr:polysaccharide biosynthesis tyrosine autokinase [Cyclobacteriaceae bacterium]
MSTDPFEIDYQKRVVQPESHLVGDLDLEKLYTVLRKSWVWILLIVVSTNLAAYLVIRWTKPLFESYSDLKLNIKNDASLLGILEVNEEQNLTNLSGEIELLKSKLFFDKVIRTLDLNISYYSVGNILEDEKYHSPPFRVEYQLFDNRAFDKTFTVAIRNAKEFTLGYPEGYPQGNAIHQFGETIETEHLKLKLLLNQSPEELDHSQLYSFKINSANSLIRYLEANLEVEPLNLNANTIRISFRDHNKYKARDLVNAIDTIYLTYTKDQKNKANRQKIDFLDQQLLLTQARLQDYENYFESFTIKNKTTDVQSDLTNTIKAISELDSQRLALQKKLTDIEQLQASLVDVDRKSEAPLGYSHYDPEINSVLTQLDQLREEREILMISYNENTFAVTKKDQEIALAQENLQGLLAAYQRELQSEQLVISSKKITLDGRLRQLPAQGTEFSSNQRNFTLYEEFLLTLMKLKADFQIAQAGTVTDFVILSAAVLPQNPVSPNKLIVYGIGFVSGFIISLLFVGVRYVMHNKITSMNEIEQLTNLPLLGVVPHYDKEKMEVSKLIINHNPKSPVSESLRTIRTNMEFLRVPQDSKIISVTSTVSGEGKTFLAINLGGIIGLSKQKVLLVDMDMRRPKIHAAFGMGAVQKGLSTILINKHQYQECIQETEMENLHYLPAGPTPPNPSELLIGDEVDELFKKLKETYQTIILDTPPVGLVTDGILAMKKADVPIYVIRADYSRKDFINSLNRLAKTNRFNNLSIVLNSVQTSGKRGYGYGYGYGNGYYE